MTDDKTKIAKAFAQLRRKGYIARMNFMCCSSCGWYEIGGSSLSGHQRSDIDPVQKAVFYNKQAEERAFRPGPFWNGRKAPKSRMLQEDLYLQWFGNADEILMALKANGLNADWEGSPGHGIVIKAS